MKRKLLTTLFGVLMTLIAGAQVVANPAANLEACDYDNPGDEMEVFDLFTQNWQIAGTQNPQELVFTYHLSQDDANTGLSAISPTAYTNISNPQTVYARVESTVDGSFDTTSFDLVVNPLPDFTAPTPLESCDTVSPGFAFFDLESKSAEIMGVNTGLQVTYFETEADMHTNSNMLLSPYLNVSNPQTIHVAIEDMSTGCRSFTTMQLIVIDDTTANLVEAVVCDDDNDGTGTFDLEVYRPQVNNTPGAIVTIHETQADATNNTGALSGLYTNTTSPPGQLFTRVEFPGLSCIGYGIIYLNLSPAPVPVNLEPLVACSETDHAAFDLSGILPQIMAVNTGVSVSIYESQMDAEAMVNPVAVNLGYTNITNPQTLYVRISNGFECFVVVEQELQVNATDVTGLNDVVLSLCLEQSPYDLTTHEAEILNGQTGVSLTYYVSSGDAYAGNNPIVNPEVYAISESQIIYVRVESASGCFSVAEIDITYGEYLATPFPTIHRICNSGESITLAPDIINPELYQYFWYFQGVLLSGEEQSTLVTDEVGDYIFEMINLNTLCVEYFPTNVTLSDISNVGTPTPLIGCDYSGTDGSALFNLWEKEDEILVGSNTEGLELTFYKTLSDANQQVNAIERPEAFFNTTAFNQTIYVRVDDTFAEGCETIVPMELQTENCQIVCDTPVQLSYCYTNNDFANFTFTSADGSPLTLHLTDGIIDTTGNDHIQVLDSDGTVLYTGQGNDQGDVSAYVFQSTGDTITLQIISDMAVSCYDDGGSPIEFQVYCSTTVGVINATAFLDENLDGVFDTSESIYGNGYFTYEVNDDGIQHFINSSDGTVSIVSNNASDSYDVYYHMSDLPTGCYTVTIPVHENITVNAGTTIDLEFPVQDQNNCEDLSVLLINTSAPPRPGFSHTNLLVIYNSGLSDITSGTISFEADSELQYSSVFNVDPNYTVTDTGNGFTLDFVNLLAGESSFVYVQMYCPPTVPLGTIVTNTATYVTDQNDVYAVNNTATLSEEVVGSYDPNDKRESHGPRIVYDDFVNSDEYLYYTIRFQNLGTADAITVRIEDDLDAQLDTSTFQMLRASHDYVVTLDGQHLEWQFDDIHLPAAQDDEPGSHGYVYFKIKPQAGYALNDIIPNTAAIYFDFNAPVITNTFETEFVENQLSIDEVTQNVVGVYPNPVKDQMQVQLMRAADYHINVYDIHGKFILAKKGYGQQIDLDVSHLASGMYFLEITSENNLNTRKFIKE